MKRKNLRTLLGRVFLAALIALTTNAPLHAAIIGAWDVNGLSGYGPSPFNPGTTAANTTVTGWTRGPGVDLGGTAAANAWGGRAWDFANDSGDFALFTVKANAGFELSLSSFDPYNIRRSGTGPTSGQWQYSLDGTTFNNIGSAITWGSTTSASGNAQGSINLSGIAALQNVPASTTVSFRIQNFGGAGTGTWYINNLSTPGNDMVLNGLVAAIAAGNNSIITAPASAAFGRVMQGQTPSQNVSLTKTGTDATTYTAIPSNNGIGITADGSIAGGNVNELVGVQLMNNANGSASTGVKAYTLTIDNTAADGGVGQGSNDPNDVVNIGATVVGNRTINAPAVNFGSVIVGASTGAQLTTLSTIGDDNNNTRVTVNGTAGSDGSVAAAAGSAQVFDDALDSVGRSLSGSFVTAGPKSGSVPLATTGEGLAGEAVNAVSVPYTADAYDPSTAVFDSNSGTTLSLDFGTFSFGSGLQSLTEAIGNLLQTAGYTAELDFDSIVGSGDTSALFTDLVDGEFAGVAAGTAYSFLASFDTNNAPGEYSATYTLGLSDADSYIGAGAAGSQSLTLNLTGRIIPEPSSILLLVLGGIAMLGIRRRKP